MGIKEGLDLADFLHGARDRADRAMADARLITARAKAWKPMQR